MALRTLTGLGARLGAVLLGASACGPADEAVKSASEPDGPDTAAKGLRMGAEWESHSRTFMSWPALESVWAEDLPHVREDIARIARAIGEYEYVVMMARPEHLKAAQKACGRGVEVIPLAVDDLWARDTVPVFVEQDGKVTGVDFNFNGWGDKQAHANDAKVGAALLAAYDLPRRKAPLVAEGGSFETDGEGTLLVTESSIVNDNRNPGRSRQQIEDELEQTLGVQKVIWLKGVRGQDITDAHVDSLVRFTAPGVVLLDRAHPDTAADSWSRAADQAKAVLSEATDAKGRPLEIVDLPQPDLYEITGEGDDFVSAYANFYVANDSVFMPEFGDRKADKRARSILREHFPKRDIVPVRIDTVASGGGGIHCSTHDEPGKPAD
ncbi:agmatine deiminase family protein [Streptomyces sp. p1417]|uniref:Agmatine deiminase family protein n=1 Tax=Streptomyces typhae TaxID=2681492 RepID=A0A6L6X4B8_9ACTN|nr:agmatine deiminase family protein [Streptomyces typhae]MVO88556.1 agmatine deiminase family protein [Streptomyces typhae]